MRASHLISALQDVEKRTGVYAFSLGDIAKLFPDEAPSVIEKSLQRHVRAGMVEHPCRGVYLNAFRRNRDGREIEAIAAVLRRGDYSYVSLESALSEYGAISQIPVGRLTIMTTGSRGEIPTPYGIIEFTPTVRSPAKIVQGTTKLPGRLLPMATLDAALTDLRHVGRNLHLVDPGIAQGGRP